MTLNFARVVYCGGVNTWYVRLGSEHGIDVMFKQRGENHAKAIAKLINASLNRDIAKWNKRANP